MRLRSTISSCMSLTLGAPPCEATQATLLSRLVGEGDCLDRKRHPDASALSSHAEGEAASTDMFRDMLGQTSMMCNREQPRLVSLVVPLLAKSELTLTVPQRGRANMLHAHAHLAFRSGSLGSRRPWRRAAEVNDRSPVSTHSWGPPSVEALAAERSRSGKEGRDRPQLRSRQSYARSCSNAAEAC